jgi:FkbM family methyltransferase
MNLDKGRYMSPRWSWEILDCAMPMTFDTYSNCAHQCNYCFAYFQRAVGQGKEAYLHHKVKSVDIERVKRMFLDPDQYAGQFAGYIKNRFVLQWGGLSDGFDWYEKKFRKSLELLRFFKEIDYPISISTKGTWFVDDPEYIEVLEGAGNTHWKLSIITLDDDHAKKLEAGVVPPLERFEAMRKLNALGVGATTLRFRPFIVGTSDLHYKEMFDLAVDVGCYSVTTEFLCLERRASENHKAKYKQMSDVVGYDLWDYYTKNSYSGSGLMRLNYDLKRPFIRNMQAYAEKIGLPFFVSDAHHKEASAGAGCCGLPSNGPLSQYNSGQYSEAIQIAKKNGVVTWQDIEKDAHWMKEIPFVAAEGYNNGSTIARARSQYHNMYDFMRDIWNTPKSWSSPARYFGGALVPSAKDENGDIVYLYNEPFITEGIHIKSVAELSKRMADNRIEITSDGEKYGHIAFPVFVEGKEQLPVINNERIHSEPAKTVEEVRERLKGENLIYGWFVSKDFKPAGTVRGTFSDVESRLGKEDYNPFAKAETGFAYLVNVNETFQPLPGMHDLDYKVEGNIGYFTRPGTSDATAYKEVVTNTGYKRRYFPIEPGQKWLDLGANVGAFSVWASSIGIEIVGAYEPEPNNANLAQQNLAYNGFGNVPLHETAVSYEGGEFPLYLSNTEYGQWRHSLYQNKKKHSITIKSVPFSELLEGVDGVKMDIEGSEIEIIENLNDWGSVKMLVLEWHFDIDNSIPRFKKAMKKLSEHFENVRYNKLPDAETYDHFPPARIVFCW